MKKLEIKIDRPCSEKWETFEKRGLNGFCSSCQKEVVDFTKMSDRQIKDYFLKTKGDVCGRMRKNQQKQYEIKSETASNPLQYLVAASALLFASSPAVSQSKKDKIVVDAKYDNTASTNIRRTVSGKVTDDSGESLPGVNVVVKGTTTGTTTDLDGNYRIDVNEGNSLIFSFIGFETQEVAILDRSIIDIALGGSIGLIGEVIVGGVHTKWYSPRSLWWRVKGFFGRIF
ncbi:MAG: carboxypeptidase-like regulatory domain-containing protein [Ekhidna sp.]|uniref:carboxypeptidase-like regulatory domain-containing protein n=1 Tax=Ekhidna sp. TaxID=2608089 RepID=UPI0032EF6B1B